MHKLGRLIFLFVAATGSAGTALPQGLGPIHIRNQFPATLPFLDLEADEGWTLSSGELRIEMAYAHANTFSRSANVVREIKRRRERVLTRDAAAELIAAGDNSSEFLLDMESDYLAVHLSYGLRPGLSLRFSLPVIAYEGGIMDGFIEAFHRSFDLPDDNRPEFRRNATQAFLRFGRSAAFLPTSVLDGLGIGDVVISTKVRLRSPSRRGPAVAGAVVVKVPTGDFHQLRGSGSLDMGMRVALSQPLGKNNFHLDFGMIRPGRWRLMPAISLNPFYALHSAVELRLGNRTSLLLQDYASNSPFRQLTHSRIAKTAHEFTLGLKRLAANNLIWSYSITENYVNFRNSPDIGFHIGVEKSFAGSGHGR